MENTTSYLVSCILICTVLYITACSEKLEENDSSAEDIVYHAALAEELGADNYGMASYVIAFLRSGPNDSLTHDEAVKLQRAHLDNIERLAEEGKLSLAGPFFGSPQYRGLYIFDVKTIEEAIELTNTDPAIQAGALEMEMYIWYGSAALKKVYEIHKSISKDNP